MHMLADVTAMQLYCLRLGRLMEAGGLSDAIAALAKLNNTVKARQVTAEARNLLAATGSCSSTTSSGTCPDIERSTPTRGRRRSRRSSSAATSRASGPSSRERADAGGATGGAGGARGAARGRARRAQRRARAGTARRGWASPRCSTTRRRRLAASGSRERPGCSPRGSSRSGARSPTTCEVVHDARGQRAARARRRAVAGFLGSRHRAQGGTCGRDASGRVDERFEGGLGLGPPQHGEFHGPGGRADARRRPHRLRRRVASATAVPSATSANSAGPGPPRRSSGAAPSSLGVAATASSSIVPSRWRVTTTASPLSSWTPGRVAGRLFRAGRHQPRHAADAGGVQLALRAGAGARTASRRPSCRSRSRAPASASRPVTRHPGARARRPAEAPAPRPMRHRWRARRGCCPRARLAGRARCCARPPLRPAPASALEEQLAGRRGLHAARVPSSSWTPSSASSRRICVDSPGWATHRRSAAGVKLRSSATATK